MPPTQETHKQITAARSLAACFPPISNPLKRRVGGRTGLCLPMFVFPQSGLYTHVFQCHLEDSPVFPKVRIFCIRKGHRPSLRNVVKLNLRVASTRAEWHDCSNLLSVFSHFTLAATITLAMCIYVKGFILLADGWVDWQTVILCHINHRNTLGTILIFYGQFIQTKLSCPLCTQMVRIIPKAFFSLAFYCL